MEALLRFIAEQDLFCKLDDDLSRLISQTLNRFQDELREDELEEIQAARGSELFGAAKRRV